MTGPTAIRWSSKRPCETAGPPRSSSMARRSAGGWRYGRSWLLGQRCERLREAAERQRDRNVMFGRILERNASGFRPGAETSHEVVRDGGGGDASAGNAALPG